MTSDDRKAAIRAYKEQKIVAGIYAVRCQATGECWVGQSPDLSKIQNRLWFTLRQGSCPHPSLQAAWHAHGPAALAFEVVERFDDETSATWRDPKKRAAHWAGELDAVAI